MKEGDSVSSAQLGESGFQLEGLFNRLMHKLFDEILSPGRQRAAAVAAGKALDPGKSNSFDLPRLAIQNGDACFGEDRFDLLLLAGVIIVVTYHRHDWNVACALQ